MNHHNACVVLRLEHTRVRSMLFQVQTFLQEFRMNQSEGIPVVLSRRHRASNLQEPCPYSESHASPKTVTQCGMLCSHLLEEKKLSRSDSNQANSRTIKRDLHSLCLLMQKIYHHRIPSHTVQTCPDVILMPMDLEFLRRLPETKIPAFNAIVAKWIRLHVLNLL